MNTLDVIEQLILANSPSPSPPSVAECLAQSGTPSASIAILHHGAVSSRCYSSVGDDTDTIFQACSISKAVTALAIMRLVDQGRFSLQSTIAELLPADYLSILTEASPSSQKRLIESITIKQLMSHTAGLSVPGFPGYPHPPFPDMHAVLRGEYPANTPRVRLQLLPGKFSYSGGGITLLQLILEATTSLPFATLMRDLVFEPLRMTRSFFGALPPEEKNAARSYDTGHRPSYTAHHYQPEYAAAGLWTTPTDLLKAVQAVQRSLTDDDFLRRQTALTMLDTVDDETGMALSWFVSGDDDARSRNFSHGGANLPGFRCVLFGFTHPSLRDCGIAVMTNSPFGQDAYWRICLAVGYVNKWPVTTKFPSLRMMTPHWDPQAVIGRAWEEYKGTWTDGNAEYTVGEDHEQQWPALWFDGFGPIRLRAAAAPGCANDEGVCAFVLEGLEMVLRMGDEGKLVLEDGAENKTTELRRLID